MTNDNRATAERIAPFTLTDADRYTKRNSTTFEQDIVDAVNEDRKARDVATHHDRTAEREAAKKAWDVARDMWIARDTHIEFKGLAELKRKEFDAARDRYLAAEFDAGERVTLSDGSVVELDPDGVELVRRNIARSIPRVAKREHWPLLVTELTGADFDAVKRLAEQRGAER